jgi:hypothetical protein
MRIEGNMTVPGVPPTGVGMTPTDVIVTIMSIGIIPRDVIMRIMPVGIIPTPILLRIMPVGVVPTPVGGIPGKVFLRKNSIFQDLFYPFATKILTN